MGRRQGRGQGQLAEGPPEKGTFERRLERVEGGRKSCSVCGRDSLERATASAKARGFEHAGNADDSVCPEWGLRGECGRHGGQRRDVT